MRVGLALSGGGVRGVAHLGVIKALEENDIMLAGISGTSAGAIIGALYSAGHSVDDILKIILGIKAFKFMSPALSWTGILKMSVIEKFLQDYLPDDDFSALKIPLFVAATNLKTGKTEYFSEGKLRSAICASSCIPVLFDPVSHSGNLYIDGGILNNLPVQPLQDSHDFIIGSHCNPIDNDFEPRNARFVMERALMLAITQNVYAYKGACDFYIEPKGLEPYKVLDINKAKEIFEIGYEQAQKKITAENLKERLKNEF